MNTNEFFLPLRYFVPDLIARIRAETVEDIAGIEEIEGLLDLPIPSPVPQASNLPHLSAWQVVGFTDLLVQSRRDEYIVEGVLCVLPGFEPSYYLPGLQQIGVVVTQLGIVRLALAPDYLAFDIRGPSIALRFDPTWLRPSVGAGFADIEVNSIGRLSVDASGNVSMAPFPGGILEFQTLNDPWLVGNTGITIQTTNIIVKLSSQEELPAEAVALGLPAEWRGLYIGEARVWLPEELGQIVPDDLTLSRCYIGDGGFSGGLTVSWAPDLTADLFGFELGVSYLSVELVENTLTTLALGGTLWFPGMTDESGTPAPITFEVEASAEGYRIVGSNMPSVSIFGLDVDLQMLSIGFSAVALTDLNVAGTMTIPSLTDDDGQPAAIDITIGGDGQEFHVSTANLPPVNLFLFQLDLDHLAVSFNKEEITDSDIGGTLTIPGVTDDSGAPLQIEVGFTIADGVYTVIAGAESRPFAIGGVQLTFEHLAIVFDADGLRAETSIRGKLQVPAFETNGIPVPLDFELFILDNGFSITVDTSGDPAQVVEVAGMLDVFLTRFTLTKEGSDWDFGFGGRFVNHVTVPAAEDLIPTEININDFSYKDSDFDFDLQVQWASGLIVGGNRETGLSIFIPIAKDIGGIFYLDAIQINVKEVEGRTEIESLLQGARLTLGPFVGVVDGMGLTTSIVPQPGGNLGPIDMGLFFRWPQGIGIGIDAGGVKGGGYFFFDPDNGRYAGAIELSFQNSFQLAAVGLITTQLPDGSEGISVLVIVSVQFSPGIALGYGFFLSGLGGILGIHRSLQTDSLREGVKNNAVDHILFPENIIANITSIIRNLREIFPARRDQFVLGVMAKITWSVPPILQIELGLVIEFPNPTKIAILGVLKAILPTEEAAIVRLQVNFLGLIDFEKGELSFDASLYNSKILILTLAGDMAVRLSWGARKGFLLSLGGFHPAFNPPAHYGLGQMSRLSISLLSGNPRVALETYMAITSNTVQFGARIDLEFKVSKFSVIGFFGFDVLFQFSPFKLVANINAGVAVKMGGTTLLSITVDFELQGPTPWIARGTGKIEILFFSVKVDFKKTWGERREIMEPTIAALPRVVQALSEDKNWQADLPLARFLLTSQKEIEAQENEIFVQPNATLAVSQNILPLQIEITRLGSSRLSDIRRLEVQSVSIGDRETEFEAVLDSFAPASYKDMSDDDKLRSPSYVDEISGARTKDDVNLPYGISRRVDYEVRLSDVDPAAGDEANFTEGGIQNDDRNLFRKMAKGGAVGSSILAKENRIRRIPNQKPKVDYGDEAYVIVNNDTLVLYDQTAFKKGTRARADDELNKILAARPEMKSRLQIVPEYELASN